jgi:hypothetical protein
MQPFLLLLLLAYSVTSTFASAVPSNIWGRDVAMKSYRVIPVDPTNTANIESRLNQFHGDSNVVTHDTIEKSREFSRRDTQLYNALAVKGSDVNETETFLRTKVQEPDKILQHKEPGEEVTGWWWLMLDTGALEEVKEHKGIVNVEIMKKIEFDGSLPSTDASSSATENHPIPEGPPHARRASDTFSYTARANKTSNVEDTERFLLTRVSHGITPGRFKRDGTIVGWYNLELSDAAAKEVQEYEGILSETFRRQRKIVPFRALDLPRPSATLDLYNHELHKKNDEIFRRASGWEKQRKADKALVVDSQYQ